MKQIIDFLPILVFFIAYKAKDIYFATAILMAATIIQSIALYLIDKKLQPMQKVTLFLVLGFGTLTLAFHNDTFIKWKPTVLYSLMAIAIYVYTYIFKKDPLKSIIGMHLTLPDDVWKKLTVTWIAYATFMACINAYVASFYTTDQWMNFKMWGYIFPIAFLIAQVAIIAPSLKKQEL